MNLNKNTNTILTLVFSILALIISIRSCDISKDTLNYTKTIEAFKLTPGLLVECDTIDVKFDLTNQAVLQGLRIVFPDKVTSNFLDLKTKPYNISQYILSSKVKDYIESKIQISDSIAVIGNINIPVIVNYSAMVNGSSQYLRENRVLIFDVHFEKNLSKITLNSSYLISKVGYPIKEVSYWYNPFGKSKEEKVLEQDNLDVKNLLDEQLNN